MYFQSRTYLWVIGAAVLLMAGCSQADDRNPPPVLAVLESQGIHIVEEFDIEGGLRAFAGSSDDQPMAVYVTANGYAIVGTRVAPDGSLADQAQLQEIIAKPIAEQTWSRLESSAWILDGDPDAPHIVYTFSDANCPYCNKFWEAARPWIESGAVQLRHIMVGIIRADSANKAAAILEAKDPSAALAQNEQNFGQGGIAPLDKVSTSTQTLLADHQTLMFSLGFRGTPGMIARDSDGLLQKISGFPDPQALQTLLGPNPAR